jgi:CHAT domain-containing protein
VLVLELPDGTTLITSGARLEDELKRVAPEAASAGALKLDEVQPRGAASRGLLDSLGRLVSRVFVLDRGGVADAIIDEALEQVRKLAGDALADKLRDGAEWGIDYLATRALMWAIERRLLREPGLYRWVGAQKAAADLFSINDRRLVEAAGQGPLLVFIHGTGSHTTGSFGDLRAAASEAQLDWDLIEARYGERVYGLEHCTFSESPIENALLLARTLPAGAQIDLVTHSRGGIVGDLLCVDWNDAALTQELIDGYRRFRTEHNEDAEDLDKADARDRRDLLALVTELGDKRFVVGRYVRVAAPVNGTLLAGSNLDLFLSGLLTLFGVVTTLQASPYYLALKRIVLEIARNRADANRVPGLEAMLPGSAVSRLLRLARPQKDLRLGVIAGDIEGASRFKRLVEFLADWAIYERNDNDLVVDTASMATGVARPDNARRLFVQGPRVDHFSYFGNADSRAALAGWLTAPDPAAVPGFDPLPRGFAEPRGVAVRRGGVRGQEGPRPVVIVLPGIMGSHLQVGRDRVWFDPLDIARGGLEKIAYRPEDLDKISAEKLFEMFYGDLCEHLERTHRVLRYPYDWRRPVQRAAVGLARELRTALAATAAARLPVRILAHSMGGLVTRAMAAAEPDLWQDFLARDGSRFVMLGTPNQGSHLMVEMLLGKGDTLRKLAMLDTRHSFQQVLDLVAAFRGGLQLLPRPGFRDGGTHIDDYLEPKVWDDFRAQVFDFWFGDGKVGVPLDAACTEARSLWDLPDLRAPRVPGDRPEKVIYVCGKADNTPCGITVTGGRVKMLGTPEGDGSVSWASGRIDGIGEAYLMDASHGDLADTEEHFESLVQLLADGTTRRLPCGWPSAAARGEAAPTTIVYDAGPATVPTDEEAARSLLGASSRRRARRAAAPAVLKVACTAMDLRYAADPILVGHYENDPISGAEAIIDRDVVCNELTMRKHLGLYPGAVGTATVVLVDPNEHERQRGTQRGALVTGLGEFGKLTASSLTEAVRAAALRYLLSKVEREGSVCVEVDDGVPPLEVGLSTLLLGFNSTANIGVGDSVHAIVRGVLEANRQFAEGQRRRRRARIVRLEIVERSLDVAITAAKELRAVAARLDAEAPQLGMRVAAEAELRQKEGEGARPRLEVLAQAGYWPQLIVTDASAPLDGDEPSPAAEAAPDHRASAPDKLKYVFLSERARAEAEVVQSQPGLIETLVRLSIHRQNYDRDLSRTLFQLMVPLDFKEATRQTGSLALLVDRRTANLPWELLCADEEPLVTKTALVRRLVSGRWRQRVRSTVDKVAFVVGNPSTEGFAKAFPNKANKGEIDPPSLPGAEAEAYAVTRILRGAGYQLVESIGSDQRAVDIINRLFQRPYRILHIAAHGEFEIKASDGKARSGVLLSDGLMLTAAEVGQMEVVPDLVFLNCCHLGTIDGKPVVRGVEYNKLASSLSRELIEMGVRAVVVAGWAVDDHAGQHFAEVFYRCLIDEGRPFGNAVHEARGATYRAYRTTNTWGAFQAYGDPGFLIDPARARSGSRWDGDKFAAPQELLDQLDQVRERLKCPGGRSATTTLRALEREIAALLTRGAKGWAEQGDVQYAIGRVFSDFGQPGFARACEHYLKAIEREEDAARVPLKAIEQLANMEARSGADTGDLGVIERGGQRLLTLAKTVAAKPEKALAATSERCGVIGSAYKRVAANLATKKGAAGAAFDDKAFRAALDNARDWYQKGEGEAGKPGFSPYCALNRLMLDALLGRKDGSRLVRKAGEAARAKFRESRDYWDAMMPADAEVAAAIFGGTLDKADQAPTIIDTLADGYRQARSSVIEDARSWDSVVKQIVILATLADALDRKVLADRLGKLASCLQPGVAVPHSAEPSSLPAGLPSTAAPD